MRPRRQLNPVAREIPPPLELACPAAKSHASPLAPTLSQAVSPTRAEPDRTARPRLSVPDRQLLLSPQIIDDLLESDHPARAVWTYTQELDLALLYDRIRARGRVAGRPAIDPRLLVALWLYATLSGFTSARELAEMCLHYDPLLWLAGGVSVTAVSQAAQGLRDAGLMTACEYTEEQNRRQQAWLHTHILHRPARPLTVPS